ncbi:uncharacterized protein LOC115889024 isoform X2 [Sitophilus oryzae]|uniref:Uncharacterized protein LOC115889024 isoform X2 n=1 Tax=Sitophilus oryzae TaxID=7048 RepID=A0A6J2YNH9_SITOR|nr:uncharacterized protein LOC115889024 isoform X2 [Sitophilus oryzae]
MSVFDDVASLMNEIIREFDASQSILSLKTIDKEDIEIPDDISQIQNLHDVIIQDLENTKRYLEQHIGIVEKTELIMNILNYKMYEIQYTFRTEFDKLTSRQEKLIETSKQGPENSKIALEVVEITDEISKLEENHQNELESLKEQKIDAQKAYERAVQEMDEHLELFSKGLNKLLLLIEAEKSISGDSASNVTSSKFSKEINDFKADLDKYTELQTTGWKVLYLEEKISALLQQRGLKLLQSGLLVNDEGIALSYIDAKSSKLLDNLNPDMLKELKSNMQITGDVLSQSDKSDVSNISKMSSEDVNYLKECLGKPLTLALAEITAVQPRDPIHYLGHWLFKYRYNQQTEYINDAEIDNLNKIRMQIAQEKWHKFVEEEAKAAVIDMITHAEEIAVMNELRRIALEAAANEELERDEYEARDVMGTYNGPQTGQIPY